MFGFDTLNTLDDVQDRLSWLISRGEFEEAMQFFIENRKHIPLLRRRFYFICIGDGLSNHKSYRRVVRTGVIMLIVNFLIQPVFSLQLLDVFALFSQRFLYYNFFAALLPHILNTFFVLGLIYQWYTWVVLPRKLFERRVEPAYRIGFFALIALVAAYVAVQAVPLIKDIPMVRNSEYFTRLITEEEEIAMVYGTIIRETDREDVAATLRQELHDKYGWDIDADNYPIHYYKNGKDLFGRDTVLIYLDAEGEYYSMSRLQYRATEFDSNAYPIEIRYLRNSKIILQIVNG